MSLDDDVFLPAASSSRVVFARGVFPRIAQEVERLGARRALAPRRPGP